MNCVGRRMMQGRCLVKCEQQRTPSGSLPSRRCSVLMLSSLHSGTLNEAALPLLERLSPAASSDSLFVPTFSRRLTLLCTMALAAQRPSDASAVEASAEAPTTSSTREVVNEKKRYRLSVPEAWTTKDKMGADLLFEDPENKSTSVGVTVNPVRVASLDEFGTLEDIGGRLLAAERAKESTISATLLQQSASTSQASGATIYTYEYVVDSTRSCKHIVNAVTIFKSNLYVLNAACKCPKDATSRPELERTVQLLLATAASFDVLA